MKTVISQPWGARFFHIYPYMLPQNLLKSCLGTGNGKTKPLTTAKVEEPDTKVCYG